MSPSRSPSLALGVLALAMTACAGPVRTSRGNPLPPPAPARAGTPNTGAGPVTGSAATATAPAPGSASTPVRWARARGVSRDVAVRRAVDTASSLVGAREIAVHGTRYGDGCAALVRAAYAGAGVPLPDEARDAAALHALARSLGATRRWKPAPGDLVFLAERPGGPAEHVGLVARVTADGTAVVVHQTERGVARLHANVGKAWKLRGEDGRLVNDLLVVGGGKLPAGRLVVAFATLL